MCSVLLPDVKDGLKLDFAWLASIALEFDLSQISYHLQFHFYAVLDKEAIWFQSGYGEE